MRSSSLPRLVVPRCLVAPCRSSCPSPSRRISPVGAFHPGETAIPGEVIYSAPFSSAHLIHPGSSPHPSHGSPSHPGKQAGRARRRAVIGGSRHRHRIPAPSRLRPVSSSPRLAPRVGVRGEERLVPVGSVPSSCSCVPASFAVVKAFQSFLGSGPQPSGANKQARAARPRSAPRVGGREVIGPSPVSVFVATSIGTADKQTSKTTVSLVPSRPPHRLIRLAPRVGGRGGFIRLAVSPSRLVHSGRGTGRGSAVSGSSSGSLLMEEGQVLGPSPLLVLFCCGSSANRSYRPCSE